MNKHIILFMSIAVFSLLFLLPHIHVIYTNNGYKQNLPQGWDRFTTNQCRKNLIPKDRVKMEEYILPIVGVIDGDSVCAQDHEGYHYEIRLDGIDAPEYRQSHFREAKRFLAKKIFQQEVCLLVKEFDNYGRIIGKIYPSENGDCLKEQGSINLAMVEAGWAWMYRYFFSEAPYFSEKDFDKAEAIARKEKRGLWQHPSPQNPYECRQNKKNKKKCR